MIEMRAIIALNRDPDAVGETYRISVLDNRLPCYVPNLNQDNEAWPVSRSNVETLDAHMWKCDAPYARKDVGLGPWRSWRGVGRRSRSRRGSS